jgi:terminase small subunit / prophage DNA-packing protein
MKGATAAVLADLLGVSPRSITDLAKRGIVVRADGGGFDQRKSVRGYCDHLRKLATGRGGDAAIATATVERARLAKAQADAVELKNAAVRATMLDAGEVEATWSGILRQVRAGMLAVPSRAAQRLPHLTPHDVAEIDHEVRAVLIEIGSGPSIKTGG